MSRRKQKWATVPIGEYTIPLIGIPPEATEERCSKCKKLLHLADAVLSMDGKPLCTKCETRKNNPNKARRVAGKRRQKSVRKAP